MGKEWWLCGNIGWVEITRIIRYIARIFLARLQFIISKKLFLFGFARDNQGVWNVSKSLPWLCKKVCFEKGKLHLLYWEKLQSAKKEKWRVVFSEKEELIISFPSNWPLLSAVIVLGQLTLRFFVSVSDIPEIKKVETGRARVWLVLFA